MKTIEELMIECVSWVDQQEFSPELKCMLRQQIIVFVFLVNSFKEKIK